MLPNSDAQRCGQAKGPANQRGLFAFQTGADSGRKSFAAHLFHTLLHLYIVKKAVEIDLLDGCVTDLFEQIYAQLFIELKNSREKCRIQSTVHTSLTIKAV